jgi:hypothetical protein
MKDKDIEQRIDKDFLESIRIEDVEIEDSEEDKKRIRETGETFKSMYGAHKGKIVIEKLLRKAIETRDYFELRTTIERLLKEIELKNEELKSIFLDRENRINSHSLKRKISEIKKITGEIAKIKDGKIYFNDDFRRDEWDNKINLVKDLISLPLKEFYYCRELRPYIKNDFLCLLEEKKELKGEEYELTKRLQNLLKEREKILEKLDDQKTYVVILDWLVRYHFLRIFLFFSKIAKKI